MADRVRTWHLQLGVEPLHGTTTYKELNNNDNRETPTLTSHFTSYPRPKISTTKFSTRLHLKVASPVSYFPRGRIPPDDFRIGLVVLACTAPRLEVFHAYAPPHTRCHGSSATEGERRVGSLARHTWFSSFREGGTAAVVVGDS